MTFSAAKALDLFRYREVPRFIFTYSPFLADLEAVTIAVNESINCGV